MVFLKNQYLDHIKTKSSWVREKINTYKDRLMDWDMNNKSRISEYRVENDMRLPKKSDIVYKNKKELHEDNMEKELLKMNLNIMKDEADI